MKIDLIIKLLNVVHGYYTIGIPHLNHEYEGYQKLKHIVSKKIQQLVDKEKTPWQSMSESIRKNFENQLVFDYSSNQFPGYFIAIENENKKRNSETHKNQLCL